MNFTNILDSGLSIFNGLMDGRLTSVLLRSMTGKGAKETTTDAVTPAPKKDGTKVEEKEGPKIHFGGLGMGDNMAREFIKESIDPDRRKIYDEFKIWLLKKSPLTYGALERYMTEVINYDKAKGKDAYELLIEIIKFKGRDAAYAHVKEMTEEVVVTVAMEYLKKGKVKFDELKGRYPEFDKTLELRYYEALEFCVSKMEPYKNFVIQRQSRHWIKRLFWA